jgi:YD repeat-containing protein
MKQIALLLTYFLFGCFAYSQEGLNDKDFKKPPNLGLSNLDSVKVVRIFEASTTGSMKRSPIDYQGFLDKRIQLNEKQEILTFDYYNETASRKSASYQFFYAGDGVIMIEQLYSSNSKSYQWQVKDDRIQEIKMFKGAKKKLKAHWQYTYVDDSLLTSLVKYDKNRFVDYQIEYEYSDQNKLTRKTVAESGKATRWLVATYDAEGNLTGYRNDDDRQSRYGSDVEIERDSSDRVIAKRVMSRSGTDIRWTYTYTESGEISVSTMFDEQGNEEMRIDYTYDEAGYAQQRTVTEKGKVRQRDDYEYDDRGNLISEHIYRRMLGELDLKYYNLNKYDEANRLIRSDYWSKDYNLRLRFDFEYLLF